MRSSTIALLQTAWDERPGAMAEKFHRMGREAVSKGASLVCLPEFSLSPYFALERDAVVHPEQIPGGESCQFFSSLANELSAFVVGSLFELAQGGDRYDTAVVFGPLGEIVGACRKQHIPADIGYFERDYFGPGDSNYPVYALPDVAVATPTCYDQWFPEAARIFALHGAELIVYPTAIGSEPSEPGFDSQAAWVRIVSSHAIANGLFVAAVNRVGVEKGLTFYGSSFVADPGGEILAMGSRDNEEVVVATLDPTAMERWRRLFPLLERREPGSYRDILAT